MKISNNDDVVNGVQRDKTPKQPLSAQADFSAVLKETIETATRAQQAAQPSAVVGSVLSGNMQNLPALDKPSTIKRLENVLELLDDYRRKLTDPNVTLKDIQPLISTLENENKELKPQLNELARGDKLKQILNQTLITTSLEVIKFNKGDYIKP